MKDFETNTIGTEQALREAMELLGIKVEGSPVEAWRGYKSTCQICGGAGAFYAFPNIGGGKLKRYSCSCINDLEERK